MYQYARLLTGTLPVNNSLLTGTVPVNNSLLTGTVPGNNILLTRILQVNNSLLTGTISQRKGVVMVNQCRQKSSLCAVHRNLCILHRFLYTVHRTFLPIFCKILNFCLNILTRKDTRFQTCQFQFQKKYSAHTLQCGKKEKSTSQQK